MAYGGSLMPIQTVTLTTPSLTAYSSFSEIKTPGAGGGNGNTQACGLFVTFTSEAGAPVSNQDMVLALTDGVKVFVRYSISATATTLRGNINGSSGEYLCTLVDNDTSLSVRAFDTLGADGEGMKWVIGLTGAFPTNVTAVNVYCPPTQVI